MISKVGDASIEVHCATSHRHRGDAKLSMPATLAACLVTKHLSSLNQSASRADPPVVAQRECGHEGDDQERLPVRASHDQHAEREQLSDDQTHDDPREEEDPHHASALVLALVHVAQVVPPGDPGEREPHHAEREQQRRHDREGHGDEVHEQHVTHLKAVTRGARAVGQAPVAICETAQGRKQTSSKP